MGLQLHTLLLDSRGTTTRRDCAELLFSSQHYPCSGRQATTNTIQRTGTGPKGSSGGHCAVATFGNHEFIEYDGSTVARFGVGVCCLVVHNAFSDVVSRVSDCVDLLFS